MDVCDGKYVGNLTPEEVIEQYECRIQTHETYAGLVLDDPQTWISFGSYERHMWAINGYRWGIKHIQECNPIRYVCTPSQALSTLIRMILFRR